MPPLYVHIIDESPVRLWGLQAGERVRRVLGGKYHVSVVAGLSEVPDGERLLVVRGDYLFDGRVLEALAQSSDILLTAASVSEPVAVAANVAKALAPPAMALLDGAPLRAADNGGLAVMRYDEITTAFEERLRKSDPPFVLPVTTENTARLEELLFGAAYKGITDFITKWVWPRPALRGVRICTQLGLRPNHITSLSWVLAILAGLLFWGGYPLLGLACGWFMTFLDTVDGKLARVTVTSSKFGHLFDHVLDLVHPPFWYLAWGAGLAVYEPFILPANIAVAMWIIFAGYIAGRLVEGSFQLFFGRFGIFSWQKLDSYSRLITARRNPCLVLLTAGALVGRPDLGLEAVALWTLLSTAFLLVRLLMALARRSSGGQVVSWLVEARNDPSDRSLAVRWFAGGSRAARGPEHTP